MTRRKINFVSNAGLVLSIFIVSLGLVSFTYAQKKSSTLKKHRQASRTVKAPVVNAAVNAAINNKAPDYEHELMAVGLGVILNLPELVASDDKVFFDEQTIADIVKDLPLLAKEVEPLNSLQGQSEEIRLQTLASVRAKVEAKLTGPHAWQFAVGKRLAGSMAELIRKLKDENYQVNKIVLRSELAKLGTLLKAPPAGFPPVVSGKLKELSNMVSKKNLTAESNLILMMSKFFEVFDIISPAKQ